MTITNLPGASELASLFSSEDAILDLIVGVATFDLSGLPQEYFVTPSHDSTSWVQLVFQALGLKTLLTPTLQLGDFLHLTLDFNYQMAVVVGTPNRYVALLLKQPVEFTSLGQIDQFCQWVGQFEQQRLRQMDRFTSV